MAQTSYKVKILFLIEKNLLKKYIAMSEGGFDFGYDDPDLDHKLDNDDDDDDSDQEVDTTRPFQPGAASTPYHGGEQHEMKTMQQEQSGLPDTSYEETPLLSHFIDPEERQSKIDMAIDFIKKRFSKVDLKKIRPNWFQQKRFTNRNRFIRAKRWRDPNFKKDGSSFLKSFTEKFSKSLGPSAKEIIAEDRDTIQEHRQKLDEPIKQQIESEKIAAEKKRKSKKVKD